jgi:putative redox protein
MLRTHAHQAGALPITAVSEELLMASLGACASITVQMYAERKQWHLQGVRVTVPYARVLAEGTVESGAKVRMVDQLEMEISFIGDLSKEQRDRLFEIANRCPIHRMLVSQVRIHATLRAPSSSPTASSGIDG